MAWLDPIVRRSFGFVRRSPWWVLTITIAVVAFTTSGVAAPIVTDASGDRAFITEAESAAQDARLGRQLDARAYTLGLVDGAPLAPVTDRLDEMTVYGTPFMAVTPLLPYTDEHDPIPLIRNAAGRESTAVVVGLDAPDAAVGTSPAAGDTPGEGGLRIPDTVADELALEPGDRVTLGLHSPVVDEALAITVSARVEAVYRTEGRLPVEPGVAWGDPRGVALSDPSRPSEPARLLVADASTAVALISAMGDTAFVTWDVPWEGPVTLEAGRRAAETVTRTGGDLISDDSPLGTAMIDVDGRPVVLSSGVGDFVERADAAAAELEPLVSSIATTARVLSALIVVAAIALLTRSRRREHLLTLSMGVHPIRIAVVTVLEFLVAIAVGTGLAFAVVGGAPHLVAGQGTIARSTIDAAVSALRIQPLFLAALVGLTALAVVVPMEPTRAGAVRLVGALQGTTVAVVAAVVTGAQLVTMKGPALDSGISLLFPLFALVAGSAVVIRSLAAVSGRLTRRGVGRRRSPTTRPRSLSVWLTVRRLTSALSRQTALAVIVSVGVGMFVYCWTVAADGERGIEDKIAALGGAEATLQLASSSGLTLGSDGLPTDLAGGETIVWTSSNLYLGVDLPADLLVVDPRTFASAAAWGTSFADRPLEDLLADLGEPRPGAVGIIVAGNYADDFPDTGRIELPVGRGSIQYVVVDRIAAAPWQRQRASVAIALAGPVGDELIELGRPSVPPPTSDDQPPEPDPTAAAALDKIFRTFVWSSRPQSELDARWSKLSIETVDPNVPVARRQPEFVAYQLFLPFLRVTGTSLLVASTLALVVLGARRRDELAVEFAMTRRMGMPRRVTTASVVAGSLATALVGAATGVTAAQLLASFMTPRLDPGPSFAPPLVMRTATGPIVAAVGVVLVATLVAAAAELVGAGRARASEVLRAAE